MIAPLRPITRPNDPGGNSACTMTAGSVIRLPTDRPNRMIPTNTAAGEPGIVSSSPNPHAWLSRHAAVVPRRGRRSITVPKASRPNIAARLEQVTARLVPPAPSKATGTPPCAR